MTIFELNTKYWTKYNQVKHLLTMTNYETIYNTKQCILCKKPINIIIKVIWTSGALIKNYYLKIKGNDLDWYATESRPLNTSKIVHEECLELAKFMPDYCYILSKEYDV